jgi:hypothetical protein
MGHADIIQKTTNKGDYPAEYFKTEFFATLYFLRDKAGLTPD